MGKPRPQRAYVSLAAERIDAAWLHGGPNLAQWPAASLSFPGVTFIHLAQRLTVFTAGSRAFDQSSWSLCGLRVLPVTHGVWRASLHGSHPASPELHAHRIAVLLPRPASRARPHPPGHITSFPSSHFTGPRALSPLPQVTHLKIGGRHRSFVVKDQLWGLFVITRRENG